MVGLSGLEPPTSRLSGVRSNRLSYKPISWFERWFPTRPLVFPASVIAFRRTGGDERVRTDDPLLAKQVLSQLSYTPIDGMVGLSGLEPPTLRLSVVRSSQLSYRPILPIEGVPSKLNNVRQKRTDLRKSVGMVTNMSP